MSTGVTFHTSEVDRIQSQIDGFEGSRDYWARQEAYWDERNEALRACASAIDTNMAPLPQVLEPVERLHNSHTWEGTAANQSRTRLGMHGERARAAITTLDALVDDLQAEAGVAYNEASYAGGRAQEYRTKIELARGDLWVARNAI